MVSRVERTVFTAWWWTVDRLMLAALLALMLGGIVLSLAASPPVAARLGLEPFYFVNRHVLYLLPAIVVLLATSFLKPHTVRRLALVVFLVSLTLVMLTLIATIALAVMCALDALRTAITIRVGCWLNEQLGPAYLACAIRGRW